MGVPVPLLGPDCADCSGVTGMLALFGTVLPPLLGPDCQGVSGMLAVLGTVLQPLLGSDCTDCSDVSDTSVLFRTVVASCDSYIST